MTHIAHTPPRPLALPPAGLQPLAADPGSWARRAERKETHRLQSLSALHSAAQELRSRTLEQRTIRRTYVPAFLTGMALGGCAAIGSVVAGIATDNLPLAVGGGLAGVLTLVSSGIGLGCSASAGWHHARRAAQARERMDREVGLLVLRRELEGVLVVTDKSDVVPAPGHYSIGSATPSAQASGPPGIGAVAQSRAPSGSVSANPREEV